MKRIVTIVLCSLCFLSGVGAVSDEWVDCSSVLQLDTKYPYGNTTSLGVSLGYSQYLGYILGYATYTDIIYAPWKSGRPLFASETVGLSGQVPLSSTWSLFTTVGPTLEVSVVDQEGSSSSSSLDTKSVVQFGLGTVFGARVTFPSDIGMVFGLKGSWYFLNDADGRDAEKNAFSVAGFVGATLGIGSSYDPGSGSASPYY